MQIVSGILEKARRRSLDKRWTITPVGGSDKVPTFVALIGAQRHLKVATLVDFQKKDRQTIENLYKRKLLKKTHVLTLADFTGTQEADVEDMFDEDYFLELVNAEFADELSKVLVAADLTSRAPRITIRIEDYLSTHPMKAGAGFSHYRLARFFAEKGSSLREVPEATLDRFEKAFSALNALLG